jgi:O-acetyl-ADP-ribose deacetylase (regulator of RNase III)
MKLMKGDLFAGDFKNIAHGCNCRGSMGAGIAVEFKRRYPEMAKEYTALCRSGSFKPGDAFISLEDDGRIIINLATQQDYRGRNKAKIKYIKASLRLACREITSRNLEKHLAMPFIGAGLGGLPGTAVLKAIQDIQDEFPDIELIVITVFKAGMTPEPIKAYS